MAISVLVCYNKAVKKKNKEKNYEKIQKVTYNFDGVFYAIVRFLRSEQ